MKKLVALWALLAFLILPLQPLGALTLNLDYSYDTSGFFDAHPDAKTDLLYAASWLGIHLSDNLTAITPSGGNTWTAKFYNPASTGTLATISNPSIAANTITIYVGAESMSAGLLGQGAPGWYSASGTTQAWLDTVAGRGQAGALTTPATDFGPWGGSLSFNSSASWYFDPTPSTLEAFGNTQSDFLSVAFHELTHVLGLGTADSWTNLAQTSNFLGTNATAVYGSNPPLSSDRAHWADGTTSFVFGTTTSQAALMDPALLAGTRTLPTTLDMAGLQDVGWMVVPEPSIAVLASVFGLVLIAARSTLRRHRRS
jgi:hypothetical protein